MYNINPAFYRPCHATSLRDNLVNPLLLHLLDLSLEVLNLLPAIQRPPVILRQTPHDLAPRALHAIGQGLDLLACLELLAQILDLLVDSLAGLLVLAGGWGRVGDGFVGLG